jgi:hypothetical protein
MVIESGSDSREWTLEKLPVAKPALRLGVAISRPGICHGHDEKNSEKRK